MRANVLTAPDGGWYWTSAAWRSRVASASMLDRAVVEDATPHSVSTLAWVSAPCYSPVRLVEEDAERCFPNLCAAPRQGAWEQTRGRQRDSVREGARETSVPSRFPGDGSRQQGRERNRLVQAEGCWTPSCPLRLGHTVRSLHLGRELCCAVRSLGPSLGTIADLETS